MTEPEEPLVAVIDYGIGNLRSAQKALQHVGADARLTADAGLIADAAAVVLPGVGAFGRCMEALTSSGLDGVVADAATSGRPFLGICVGMQLLYEGSEESPATPGLGIVGGSVLRLPDDVKRPQMQWNVLRRTGRAEMLVGLPDPVWVYFVHSYAPERTADTVAVCDYGTDLTSAVEVGPVWATQFHPEKSGSVGLEILSRFVEQVTCS